MPDQDLVLLLSRGQFALTIGMHIVLAAFTLGLSHWLVWAEGMWLWKREPRYMSLYRFWLKIFILTVAVGAVSGVVMEFQFGTNWGPFSRQVGGIIGPLMFYEVLIAFFLESALAGAMYFGIDRIGPRLHFAITCLVALGAEISAFWILAANSWMHTPTGYFIEHGIYHPQSWISILLAPSFPWRLSHMVLAALLGTAFLIAGTGAWRLRRKRDTASARLMVSSAMWAALVLMPVQVVVGDLHGENTLAYQPQKVAAMEGAWHPPPEGQGEPMRLFALPLQDEQRNALELAIPNIGSLYLRHNLSGHIRSLSEFPARDLPPVAIVFFAFRIMVGLGLLMLLTALIALVLRLRRRLFHAPRFMLWLMLATPSGFIAMLAGWVVTETGRQPWLVWERVRTAAGFSAIPLEWMIASAAGIVVLYSAVFAFGLRYFFHYAAHYEASSRGPGEGEEA